MFNVIIVVFNIITDRQDSRTYYRRQNEPLLNLKYATFLCILIYFFLVFVSTFRPDFAPQSSDEEDEDMEVHIQARQSAPPGSVRAERADIDGERERRSVDDRRLRRLQRREDSESEEEEEDRQAR